MKRILILVFALCAGATSRAVYFTSAPSTVNSGASYTVAAEEWGGDGSTEVLLFRDGSLCEYGSGWAWASVSHTAADYGSQSINYEVYSYLYDNWGGYMGGDYAAQTVTVIEPNHPPTINWVQNPTLVPVGQNYAVQAHAHDEDGNLFGVLVDRDGSPYAYHGGEDTTDLYSDPNLLVASSPGQTHFQAYALDNSGAASDVINHTVNIYVPNAAPTITWINHAPANAWINQAFAVQAKGHDDNGNLSFVRVWRNDEPFAFNGGGDGYDSYSDNNTASGTAPGYLTFKALAIDADGAESGFISETTVVSNRAPTMTPTEITGPTVTWDSQYIHYRMWAGGGEAAGGGQLSMTSTIQDADGNLVNHTLRYRQASVNPNTWYLFGDSTASGSSSTKQYSLNNVETPGQWDFNAFGHDGLVSHPGESKTVWVYGNTNGATFVSQTINGTAYNSAGATLELKSGDLTATAVILMRNTGTKLWRNADGTPHRLGAIGPNPLVWGANVRDMPANTSIDPEPFPGTNDTASFAFTFNIPQTPTAAGASYTFQWKMLEQGVAGDAFFEGATVPVAITVVDTTLPTVPVWSSPAVTARAHDSFSVSWQPATDNVAIAGYEVVLMSGSTVLQTVPKGAAETTCTFSGLTPDTAYTVKVRAKDNRTTNNVATPNWSSFGSVLSVTTKLLPTGDYDGDGMSNGWEEDHGLNPRTNDASADSDNDGLSGIAEYNLGTDPQTYNAGTSTLGGSQPAGWPNANGNSAKDIGTTVGSLQVDKNGAATYSIPIWTTSGSSGMQPQVSLNYSSQAGAGIAGFGWSIGGASAITRGPQTLAVDGKNLGVTMTLADRFYLDGQRLVLVTGTTYGASATEYRTEPDTFTKVVANGQSGSGPASFTAWTKAGLKIEFGNTTDSAFNPGGGATIHSWRVNRIEDTAGNYMVFLYEESTTDGTQLLTRIDYTGNGSVQPYASLRFEYESRPDSSRGFLVGLPLASLKRLTAIKSYCSVPPLTTGLARTYTLGYTARTYTSRSMLTSITETGADGRSYPDLTFAYNDSDAGWTETNVWKPAYFLADNMNDGRPAGTGFVDLDADGRVDFVARRDGAEIKLAKRNTGSGWEDASSFLLPHPLANQANSDDQGGRFVDVNGDGRVDFLYRKQGAGGEDQASGAYINTGSGWTSRPEWTPPAVIARDSWPERGGRFVDVNGDGRVDFVASHGTGSYRAWVYLNTGSGWIFDEGYSGISVPTNDVLANYRPHFIDLNGDGLVDIAAHFHGGGSILLKQTWLNNGSGWALASASYQAPEILDSSEQKAAGSEFADVNADGLPDLVWYREMSGTMRQGVAINTGTQFVQNADYASAFAPPAPLSRDGAFNAGSAFIDVNADGFADLLTCRQFTAAEPIQSDVQFGTGRNWAWAGNNHPARLPYLLLEGTITAGVAQTGADFVDFNSDGVVDVVWYRRHTDGTNFSSVQVNKTSPVADRLKQVTNALGVSAEITYGSLMDSAVYACGSGGPGQVNVIGPLWVVKSVKNDDGATGAVTRYTYRGLRSDRVYGSLGFDQVTSIDDASGIATETDFAQEFPYIGMAVRQATTKGGVTLSETLTVLDQKSLNTGKSRFIFAKDSDTTTKDLNGADVSTAETSVLGTDIDDYGNIKKMTVTTNPGAFSKVTVSEFTNDATLWRLGRLTSSTVTSSATGKSSIVRKSSFDYYPATGLLKTETIEPDQPTLKLTTEYEYDAFGNKTKVTVTGKSLTVDGATADYVVGTDVSRTTETQYDTRGRFPLWTKNALGHQENYTTYDETRGVLTAMTGANGLPTSWQYDGFGRKLREDRADGTATITTQRWAGSGAPSGTAYSVETETSGAPPALAFFDKFGRACESYAVNGDGAMVRQTTVYDARGRITARSNPYFPSDLSNSGVVYWTQHTAIDDLNRPVTIKTPDSENGEQITTYSYNGLTIEVTDAKNRVSQTVKNAAGWTVKNVRNKSAGTTANDYSEVTYDYDVLGNLTSTNAAGTGTSLTYDLRGRKTSMTDADMGTWQYRYNIFGELIWQKDAKGQTVTMSYDALGRMTSRVEPEGTTIWTYDTAPKSGDTWKGKLASVSAPGSYAETYAYDSVGRPQSSTRTIDGTAYTAETAYDSVGRVIRTKYPATGIGSSPVSTRNVYNAFGYLKEIRNWLDADTARANSQLQGLVYWQAEHYDRAGKLDSETYGNGLQNLRGYSAATGRLAWARIDRGAVFDLNPLPASFTVQQLDYAYDAVGNVTRRNDQTPGFARDERFSFDDGSDGYDGLDRLRVYRLHGVSNSAVTVAYSANGNISSKSDLGTYSYVGYGPHAVSAAGVNSYTYDAVGNMLTGAGRNFGWTSFNQMRYVKSSAGLSSEFFFGAGHERVKQIRRSGSTVSNGVLSGTTTDATIHVGALYEKVTTAATNTVEHKHYIMAPTGRIAVVTQSTVNGTVQANTTRYFHTDGLGSITVVSDEAGRVLKRYTYDAWGKQAASYTNTSSGITNQAPTTRGFTDHEMLSDFGLIHMNGRVYDPTLGRFLSADPNVDGVADAQGFNRYSYVGNNPLGYTDPTGYLKFGDLFGVKGFFMMPHYTHAGYWLTPSFYRQTAGQAMGFAVTAVITHFSAGTLSTLGAAAGGYVSAFNSSLLNGASVGDAFRTGVIGAATGAVTAYASGVIGDVFKGYGYYGVSGEIGRAAAHGVVGGAVAEAEGGEFRHGFYSSAAASAFGGATNFGGDDFGSVAARTVVAAAVGGTVSMIGGGKFGNAALTAAFQHLFNAEAHRDWLDRASDFAAGFGDTVTCGVSRYLRDKVFTNFYAGTVNYDSTSYTAGEVTAVAATTVVGGVQGLRSAGSMAGKAGAEFSHWIPARMGGARSLFNGNFVSKATHALSDPYRYRFMPRAWKLANPMPNVLSQQLTRLPMVYTYGAAGAATGGAGVASNHLLFGN